nr:retrovirus-related Pol polyprotein from transposon TNT 1-94 [Tanacetum cinerariifolium]
KKKIWKPTGKVFTTIGYKWRPTGRTFKIVGNVCPLTRITTTAIVPLRKPIPLESNTSKPVVTLVYSRKPKESINNVPVRNSKINKSLSADKKDPNKSWGSIISNVPSSLTIECRLSKLFSVKFGNDHVVKIMGYGDYKIGNVTISRVYFVKGLGLASLMKHQLLALHSKKRLWLPHVTPKIDPLYEFVTIIMKRLASLMKHQLHDLHSRMGSLKDRLWQLHVLHRIDPFRLRHGKTPYELLHSKLPDLSFFHVFGALCYPTDDSENLGKLQPKADIGIFIGYAPTKKAFCIYNRCTRRIVETIHVDFDELIAMASEQSSSGPALNDMAPGTISSRLVRTSSSSTSYVPPTRNDWDLLFQPMFDELLNPPPSVVNQAAKVIAPIAEVIP